MTIARLLPFVLALACSGCGGCVDGPEGSHGGHGSDPAPSSKLKIIEQTSATPMNLPRLLIVDAGDTDVR